MLAEAAIDKLFAAIRGIASSLPFRSYQIMESAAESPEPKRNVFGGEIETISSVDLEAPIRGSARPSCEDYLPLYAEGARVAESTGDNAACFVYWFLSVLVGFAPTYDVPGQPYTCWVQMKGRRSELPEDLTDSDICALEVLASLAKDSTLRARLHDLLFLLRKDHIACQVAVDAYLGSAPRLDNENDWPEAYSAYKRAMQLAQRLGTESPSYSKATTNFLAAVGNAVNGADNVKTVRYLRLANRRGLGSPSEFAENAKRFAELAGDYDVARSFWELAEAFYRRAGNDDLARVAKLAAAETYVAQAMVRGEGLGGSALAASALLVDGLHALRQARAEKARIIEARAMLAEYQEASASEMKTFSSEIDISEDVKVAQGHVKSDDFRDALFRLAFGKNLTNIEELRVWVEKAADQFPLSYSIGSSMTDVKGRIMKNIPAMSASEPTESGTRLEEEMFSHAARFLWSHRASAFIYPALQQIYNDHHPELDDLRFVVEANLFVPHGHEDIFLRGIHAGFHGDLIVASHLLTPQIENSIRHVLETAGVDVSDLRSDGTQPLKMFGGIFALEDTKRIFGEELVFELRGCLNEKSGYDFRNQVAHGFVSSDGCHSNAAVTVWWLVLRICLIQVWANRRAREASKTTT